VIHTGAGNFSLADYTAGEVAERHRAMEEALRAGHRVLAEGGDALDAVQAAINVLEDSPLFNAGRGAVFTHEGTHELDAAIMDGRTRNAGAVAGVKHVRNPIDLARLVMERSPHVMLAGEGAEAFAKEQGGITFVDQDYFYTERRWRSLQRALGRPGGGEQAGASYDDGGARGEPAWKFGTVGAVALDRHGNLAAGTSTGGMTNKRFGRIGDAPIIGAGTFADNQSCAVSATGHGEFFIRWTVAADICARVRYQGATLSDAADAVINGVLREVGGDGGVIAMDRHGNVAMPFNTTGMGRGYMGPDGVAVLMLTHEDARPLPTGR